MLTLGLALALLAQATPAPEGNEQIRHSLKLPNLEGVPASDDKGQQLKIDSFRWGGEAVGGSAAGDTTQADVVQACAQAS